MGSYHLRNYQIVEKSYDYVTSIRNDFALLIEKLLSTPSSLAPLNEDNEKTAGSLPQDVSDPSLDLEHLELTVNPSSFGAFDCARRLVMRHKQTLACWTPPQKHSANGSTVASPSGDIFLPSAGTPQKSVYKMVSAGLHCLVNLLVELNEKDPQVCCTALNSLFSLLQCLPVEDLSGEPKSMVDNLFQILAQLRQSPSEDVACLASSCLISLAIAYGSTDLMIECMSNFLTSIWQSSSERSVAILNISVPDSYLALYKHALNVAFYGNLNARSKISLHESNILCKFSIPRTTAMALSSSSVPNSKSNPVSLALESSHTYAAVASDGKFLYILNGDGLTKIGSGFTESKAGFIYAFNAQLKATSDSWLAVCRGSLYLRRKHSTRISVLDNDTLTEVGEILLPASVAQGTLCSDGQAFSLLTVDDVANTLSVKLLNDSFSPMQGEETKLSLAEARFIAFGDHSLIDINELMTTLDTGFVGQIVDLQITKNLAFILTNEGKLYFVGKGTLVGMQDNHSKWQEVMLQERVSSMSLSQDGQNLVLISRSGHVYAFGDKFNEDSLPRAKSKAITAGFAHKLQTPNNRKAILSACNNGLIAVITENGKFFLLGRQSGLCNPDTKQVIGLENIHVTQIAMGKTHNIVVTSQGHVFTFGANNLGQCGRSDLSSLHDSDSEKSKTDDEFPEVKIAFPSSSNVQQPLQSSATPGTVRLCAPSTHIWKREMATICSACGLCSARGLDCLFSKNRPKGSLCGCGIGLAGCGKCGICRICGKQYGASGSEIDTESDGQPFPLITPSRLVFKAGTDYIISEASCGNYHTILRSIDGKVITFGSNRNGQLGVGDTKSRMGPQLVQLPQEIVVTQVAAGANHCVIRCKDGTVYSFGKHHNGQLGRDGRQKQWFAQPGLVDGFASDSKKRATWIGAGGDVTLIRYDYALLSSKSVNSGCVAANQMQFVIIPRNFKASKQYMYHMTRVGDSVKKLTLQKGNVITDLLHYCYWCLDPLYDTLWCYRADKNEINCFAPFQKNQTEKSMDFCFVQNPEFWIPMVKSSSVSDTQLGFSLLTSYYILLDDKLRSTPSELSSNQRENVEIVSKDSVSQAQRFQSFGGGWGYSLQSVESIQFCCTRDVLVAGFGLYGGRGEYLAKLKLLKVIGDDGDDRHAETIAETDELIYMCGIREHAPLFFAKPVAVKAGDWHVAWVAINGPSSDCGSSGMQSITTEDGVTFYFKNSRLSNNGTDVHVGQIPAILYKVNRNVEDQSKQRHDDSITTTWALNTNLSSRFFFRLTPNCFTSLLKVIKLAVEKTIFVELSKKSHRTWEIERASACVILCLRVLKYFTLILYPASKQPLVEYKEFVPYIENMFQIVVAIMDSMKADHVNNYASVRFLLHECSSIFTDCYHVFFPAPSLSAHFLSALMKNDARSDWTLKAFVQALTNGESPLSMLTSSSSAGGQQPSENQYPLLLAVIRKSRKAPSGANLDCVTLLQFFMEMAFETTNNVVAVGGVGNECNLRTCATKFLLSLSNELISVKNENGGSRDCPTVLHTPKRFTRVSSAMTWDTSSGSPDAISFQVDRSGVSIHGAGVYIGYGCYTYTLELLSNQGDNFGEKWTTFEKASGVVDPRNFFNDMALIKFAKPVKLDANRVYTLRLYIQGSRTWSGEGGLHIVNGQQGVKFSFLPCSLSLNGTTVSRGQLPVILHSISERLYNEIISPETASKWMLLFVKHFVTKVHSLMQQNYILAIEPVRDFCPQLFGQLSIFVENNPSCALDLLSSFDEILLTVSCCNGERRSQLDSTPGFRTVSTMVESDHPYKPVKMYCHTVKFHPDVSFMTVEFDPHCNSGQPEDSLQLYLPSQNSGGFHPVAKFWGATNWPKKVLLLPGNSLLLTMETASNYNKIDLSQMYGFKCFISGYEGNIVDNLLWFELELVNFCALACQILMQKSYKLASISALNSDTDVKMLEEEVLEVLQDHAVLLHKGLHLSHNPTVHEIVASKVPLNTSCPELRFLHDFINSSSTTAGGKLSRWFMSEPYIDPYLCELLLDVEDLCSGKPVLITVVVKDQYGRIAYNVNVGLEIWVSSLQSALNDSAKDGDPNSSTRQGCNQLDIPHQPTYLNRARYLAITMMKSVQAYSFEELRLAHLRESLLKDILPVVSHQDGTYTSSWIPKQSGMYKIECRVDGFIIDQVHTVEVRNGQVVKKVPATKVAHLSRARMATCYANQTRGVRIRSAPSLQAPQLGIIPPSATIFYVDEAENCDGMWLRLSDEAALAFCPKLLNPSSAWCLQFHSHLNKTLLFKDTDVVPGNENLANIGSQSIIVACDELYIVSKTELSVGSTIRTQPTKTAKIIAYLGIDDIVQSTGWLQNSEGVWIQVDRSTVGKYGSMSLSGSSGGFCDGYCFVQEIQGSNVYFERILSPYGSAASSVVNQQNGSDNGKVLNGNQGESSYARQVSTQTSPLEERAKNHITKSAPSGNTRSRRELHSRLKPTVKVPPQNSGHKSHVVTAMEPTVADCIRSVFAAVLWHEHVVHDAMACAAYLKFHPELQRLQFRNEVSHSVHISVDLSDFNVPIALQMLFNLWKEIFLAVQNVIQKHLILPSPPMTLKTPSIERKHSFVSPQLQLCELCEGCFPTPVTTHMRLAHPGCGRHAGGQGYNSLGKCTGGWTGNCGDGGTNAFTWYLLCQKCRTQYLLKTETQRQRLRKMRARSFRISSVNTEPQRILKNNAMFLLELNSTDECSQMSERPLQNDQLKAKQLQNAGNWIVDLFPQNPISYAQSLHGSSSSNKTRKSSKVTADPLALIPLTDMAPFASDPGPKRSKTDDDVSLPSSEPSIAQTQENLRRIRMSSFLAPSESQLLLASPSNALKAATHLEPCTVSVHNTCRRPVVAFVIQHHNLNHLNDAMHLAVAQAVLFDRTFQIINWLLRNTTNPISIIDVLWHFVTALNSVNIPNCGKHLAHPLKLAFLAGTMHTQVIKKFHALLLSVASVLRNYEHVSLETLRCCFRAWMFNFTSQDQELILKSQILSIVSRIVSERNDDAQSETITSQEDSVSEVEEFEDMTSLMKVEVSSRPMMACSLTDGSTETFWESGDEEKGHPKSIVVRWVENTVRPLLLGIFIDNVQDASYRISHVNFFTMCTNSVKQKIKCQTLDAQFSGWVKCMLAPVSCSVVVELKGPENSVRIRQIQVYGEIKRIHEPAIMIVKHSPSMLMQFNSVQSDAFELFQLIASYAFGEDSAQDGALQQQVLNILFSKNQLHSLQSYVSSQIILALEREISLLKDKTKRNYSYCCGLIAMLAQISMTKYGKNCISSRGNTTLTSLSELLLFSSSIVQCQILEVFEKIIVFYDPKYFDAGLFLENLLIAIAKSVSLQLRVKIGENSKAVTLATCLQNDITLSWHLNKNTALDIAQSLIKFMISLSSGDFGREWVSIVQTTVANHLTALSAHQQDLREAENCVATKAFWLCVAALSVIQSEDWLMTSLSWRQMLAKRRETTTFCDNHEDGCTIASVYCDHCQQNLCPECSLVLHLSKQNRGHMMHQLLNVDTRLQIIIHEMCSRLKLSWCILLIDYATMQGLADFRKDLKNDIASGGGGIAERKCRFCGSDDASELTEVCNRSECQQFLVIACNKILQCGHLCGGIMKESNCLPCLKCHVDPSLRQDADDMCVICFTDTLSAAPCLKLTCGHVFHYQCCTATLTFRWPGPRITFSFMLCPICKQQIYHEALNDLLHPLLELKDDVTKKAIMRLSYDGLSKPGDSASKNSKNDDATSFAMNRYAYYQCYKCAKAYFGGEAICQALNGADYNPAELLCGACSNVSQAQICPRHGTEYLEYKCRYCCSIAVFFCFGTTHFCAACHDDFQRLTVMPKAQLPACPAGSKAAQLEGTCPLKVQHPPTGEEYALGCGICRNLSTF